MPMDYLEHFYPLGGPQLLAGSSNYTDLLNNQIVRALHLFLEKVKSFPNSEVFPYRWLC